MARHGRRSHSGLFGFVCVVLAAALVFLVWLKYSESNVPEEEAAEATLTPIPEATPVPLPPKEESVELEEAGGGTLSMTMAVAGDIVMHVGLNTEADLGDGSYDYTPILNDAKELITSADFAVATMETTFLGGPEYSGYPMFKSPDDLAKSLKATGFDLISTASNHSMDASYIGLERTLDVLDEAGLLHVGTYRTQEERDANNGIVTVTFDHFKIAFLSYTYGTNGIPITDSEYAVNVFCNDYLTNLEDINYDMLESDMAAARELGADIIAVIMHWGHEYRQTPNEQQYELADFLFTEGADLILGSHPHSPQPMELREVIDRDGNEKTGFICYSTGNLISCMEDKYTNLTGIINITLTKEVLTDRTFISDVSYVPFFMVNAQKYGMNTDFRYRLWDLHAAIDAYENGERLDEINKPVYDAMVTGLDDLHAVFGSDFDSYNCKVTDADSESTDADGEGGEGGEQEEVQ